MKPRLNQSQTRKSQTGKANRKIDPSSSESLPTKLILAGTGMIAVLFVLKFMLGSLSGILGNSRLNLKRVELNSTTINQQKALAKAPRYGLNDKTVNQNKAQIILRDNGAEDGDYVTLFINGQAYTQSTYITNAGQAVPVSLKPGANLVQIRADKDGVGGITVAVDIDNQIGNTSSVIPQGNSATFYIIHK